VKAAPNKQPNEERLASTVAVSLEAIREEECNAKAIASHVEEAELHRLMQLLGKGHRDISQARTGGKDA
jgi:hypothetical protein